MNVDYIFVLTLDTAAVFKEVEPKLAKGSEP